MTVTYPIPAPGIGRRNATPAELLTVQRLVEAANTARTDLNANAATIGGHTTAINGLTVSLSNLAAATQPVDADLTAIAALPSAANKVPYATGAQAWALADLTPFARTLLDDVDQPGALATLGIARNKIAWTGASPPLVSANLLSLARQTGTTTANLGTTNCSLSTVAGGGADGGGALAHTIAGNGLVQSFDVAGFTAATAGLTYTLTARVRITGTSPTVQLDFGFRDAGHSTLTTISSGAVAVTPGKWFTIVATGLAPVNTTEIQIVPKVPAGVTGDVFELSVLSLRTIAAIPDSIGATAPIPFATIAGQGGTCARVESGILVLTRSSLSGCGVNLGAAPSIPATTVLNVTAMIQQISPALAAAGVTIRISTVGINYDDSGFVALLPSNSAGKRYVRRSACPGLNAAWSLTIFQEGGASSDNGAEMRVDPMLYTTETFA